MFHPDRHPILIKNLSAILMTSHMLGAPSGTGNESSCHNGPSIWDRFVTGIAESRTRGYSRGELDTRLRGEHTVFDAKRCPSPAATVFPTPNH